MKKYLEKLGLALVLVLALAACSPDGQEGKNPTSQAGQAAEEEAQASQAPEDQQEGEEESIPFHLVISVDGQDLVDQEDLVYYNSNLGDLLENKYDAVFDGSGFLTSLKGQEQDPAANKYWLYYVNGDMPQVGILDYEVQEGDQVEFRLEALD